MASVHSHKAVLSQGYCTTLKIVGIEEATTLMPCIPSCQYPLARAALLSQIGLWVNRKEPVAFSMIRTAIIQRIGPMTVTTFAA
eukprot:scaffold19696_cov36-Prasinocladus_malaysianus.AAC.1